MNDCARLISRECLTSVDIVVAFDFINSFPVFFFLKKTVSDKVSLSGLRYQLLSNVFAVDRNTEYYNVKKT